jgi:hypothetical protein
VACLFRRNRPKHPGGIPLTQLVGYGLVVVAVVVFFLSTRDEAPSLGLHESSLPERWNEAATALRRPELTIGDLQRTTEDVIGFAWSDDLLILARVDPDAEPPRPVLELAAVGSPGRDGIEPVLTVLELVIQVVDPGLDGPARRRILSDLSLVAGERPAVISTVVRSDRIEFRATSDPDDDQIGIGAVPLLAP